jgi:hypothetical protein
VRVFFERKKTKGSRVSRRCLELWRDTPEPFVIEQSLTTGHRHQPKCWFCRNDFPVRASDNIQEFTLTQEKSATILVQ